MDSRVDSDMDRNTTRMSRDSGYTTQHNSGYSNPSPNTDYGTANTTSGPHSSDLANKVDPRVDSDNSRNNYGGTAGNYSSPSGDYGRTSNSTGFGNTGFTTTRPYSSNLANKVDPRLGSDNSGGNHDSSAGIYTSPNTGHTYGNAYGESTNSGPHKSNLMNKLDPRVDSNMDGSRNTGLGQGMNQGVSQGTYQDMGKSNTGIMPQEISSHGHATGGPVGALEGKHAKHTSGQHSP